MKQIKWEPSQKEWTKLVLTGRHLDRDYVDDMLAWCASDAAGNGQFMVHVVRYTSYVVVKISHADQAMMFKMRWA